MKSIYLMLGLFALSAGPGFAASGVEGEGPVDPAVLAARAEALELARQYVAVLEVDAYVDALKATARMSAGLDQIEDAAMRATAEQAFGRVLDRATPRMRDKVPALYEAYAHAYAREFSAQELRELIAFNESPVGRHFHAVFAKFEDDAAVHSANRRLMDELRPIMDDFAREMCSERAAKRVAAGDTKAKCSMG